MKFYTRFLTILGLLLLSACGFTPVYAQHNGQTSIAQLQQISIGEVAGREGQVLRNKLQDLLGAAGNRYRLDIELGKEKREFGIQQNLRISRYDIVMTANYSLTDNESGKVVLQDIAKTYSSFNRTESEFSTFVAEQDSVEQAAEELAIKINQKLITFFN